MSQNKTNGKHFFQFEVRIVARQIGFHESQQKLTMNISFYLKIMEARKIGFDESWQNFSSIWCYMYCKRVAWSSTKKGILTLLNTIMRWRNSKANPRGSKLGPGSVTFHYWHQTFTLGIRHHIPSSSPKSWYSFGWYILTTV